MRVFARSQLYWQGNQLFRWGSSTGTHVKKPRRDVAGMPAHSTRRRVGPRRGGIEARSMGYGALPCGALRCAPIGAST
jgi:hypothetical protein